MNCPICNSPAYIGLDKVECSNPKCVHAFPQEVSRSVGNSIRENLSRIIAENKHSTRTSVKFADPFPSVFHYFSRADSRSLFPCCELFGPPEPKREYAEPSPRTVDMGYGLLRSVHDDLEIISFNRKVRTDSYYEYKNRYGDYGRQGEEPVKAKASRTQEKLLTFIYQITDNCTGIMETYTSVPKRGHNEPEHELLQRAEVVMAVDNNGNVEVVKNRRGPAGPAEKIIGWNPNEDPDAPKKQKEPADPTNWPKGHNND